MEVQHTLKVVASDLGYNLIKDEELNVRNFVSK